MNGLTIETKLALLNEYELIRQWQGRYQYRTAFGGRWYYADSLGAIEAAWHTYETTPPAERLTRDERFEAADRLELRRSEERWGKYSLSRLKSELSELEQIEAVEPEQELPSSGIRRSGYAMQNQAARDAYGVKSQLKRYIEYREAQ